jgi:hypothetical protein
MRSLSLQVVGATSLLSFCFACSFGVDPGIDGSGAGELSVAEDGVRAFILPDLPDQDPALIDSASSPTLFPLRRENQPYLDIRGVGDAAWTGNQLPAPPASSFQSWLNKFNPNGLVYRGDVNVVNWESVVGTDCLSYNSAFGFLSSPASVREAFAAGFNIFALSNNHSRDCDKTNNDGYVGDGGAGEMATASHMNTLAQERNLIWNGVSSSSSKQYVTVRELSIGDKRVSVAFASIDLGRVSHCIRSNCYGDRERVLNALRDAKADVRILSMHSREWLSGLSIEENKDQLDKLYSMGEAAVTQAGVDVVFGSGPHIAMPVRTFRKPNRDQGVVFLSLGNFIHPLLSGQSTSLVGRVLFNTNDSSAVQVQAMMIGTNGESVSVRNFDPSNAFVGGSPWRVGKDPSTALNVGYFNLRSP